MSRTLQFRRLGTATLANTTGANGELIINTTNKTLTVHDGVTPGGFIVTGNTSTSIDQFARNTANSATTSAQAATNLAQSAYNYANTLTVSAIDQYARNEANAAVIASTSALNENIILRGVDDTQNTRISVIEGVNTTQNTGITNATNLAQAAYNYANTINVSGVDQFARNTANTASNNIIILQGVNNTQNTNISNTTNLAQLAFNSSNTKFSATGGQITGNVIIVGDLIVTGQIIGPTINAISGGGVTGNISVLATNSAINFVANSSGDGVGFSTIELVPDTNSFSDQYIVIDPTEPSHIHIRAGGVQDSSGAQLFLGGEKNYVRVTDNQGLRLQNEYTTSIYNAYYENSQYVSGFWYEESGNYFVRFTSDDVSMVNDLSNFGYGSPLNQITIEWYDGAGTVSNTMMSVSGYWYGVGNVYTAQVNSTLPANNTVLTAIAFEIFTTETNYASIENNDFTVDVKDDVRISGRDIVTIRNWSTSNPVTIVTDYDNSDYTWTFNSNGTLETPGDIIVSGDVTGRDGVNTLVLKAQPTSDTSIQLNDTVDSIISTSASLEIRTDVSNVPYVWTFENNGTITFPDASTQTGAAISIVELKALVANCATYGDFQTAIAAL